MSPTNIIFFSKISKKLRKEVNIVDQSITTNPILISMINMIVVFAVLYALSLIINLIRVMDPTQKKKIASNEVLALINPTPAVSKAIIQEDYDEMIILFTAAIAVYGYNGARIMAVRPIPRTTWSQVARMEGVNR